MPDDTPATSSWLQPVRTHAGALLALCGALGMVGCTGEVLLTRLQEDLESLRQRVHAREEIRIHVASTEPVTKTALRNEPTDPHVTVAVPPCPPAVGRVVERPRRPHGRQAAKRGKGRRG